MKTKYRIYGMITCLIVAISSLLLLLTHEPILHELAALLTMFVVGYALRETLQVVEE